MTRENAINYLYSSGMSDEQVKAVEDGLRNGWIPVEEDLPAEQDIYLVAWLPASGHGSDFLTCYIELCEFTPEEGFLTDSITQAGRAGAKVYAWMPCPELYRRER